MKKWEYGTLTLQDEEEMDHFLNRLNKRGVEGWRVINFDWTPPLSAVMERELPEPHESSLVKELRQEIATLRELARIFSASGKGKKSKPPASETDDILDDPRR